MGIFNKQNAAATQPTERQLLQAKFQGAPANLLLVVVFTLINVILLIANANRYFLFSAYVPYFVVDLAMYLCGKYPAEAYADIVAPEFMPNGIFIAAICVAAAILVLYAVCWAFSKKGKIGWLICALVLFAIDTAAMLYLQGILMEAILDYVFHAWVLFSLISGVFAYYKLKKLPEEVPAAPQEETVAAEVTE